MRESGSIVDVIGALFLCATSSATFYPLHSTFLDNRSKNVQGSSFIPPRHEGALLSTVGALMGALIDDPTSKEVQGSNLVESMGTLIRWRQCIGRLLVPAATR